MLLAALVDLWGPQLCYIKWVWFKTFVLNLIPFFFPRPPYESI